MPVTVTFSSTNGGSSIDTPVSFGTGPNGSVFTAQTIFIRHDGVNPITAVGMYLSAVDPSEYGGDATAAADRDEVLEWGDAGSSPDFGGFQINQNKVGGFPLVSWPTFANKNTVDTYGTTVRTGFGDSGSNLMAISTQSGASAPATIQAGAAPGVAIQSRIQVPDSEGVLGTRQFKMILSFTSTS